MNGSLVAIGIIAAVLIIFFCAMACRLCSLAADLTLSDTALADNGTLEKDLKDIMESVPVTEIRSIVNDYLRHDPQINDTMSFIEDQKKFIASEFRRMPELDRFVDFLAKNGLEVDNWHAKIHNLWKTRTAFVKQDPTVAVGGLAVMVQRILNTVSKNQLHKLLQRKIKYSGSFRRLLYMLRSKEFADLCDTIENNVVLQQHIFWAKQEGIEVTFAVEFLRNLHIYVTEDI